MPRATYRHGVAPTCACDDPWACTKRAPHRTWSWRMSTPIKLDSGRNYRPTGSGLPTQTEALKQLRKAEEDYQAGRKADSGGLSVAAAFAIWLQAKRDRRPRLSSGTIADYEGDAEDWIEYCGKKDVADLTPEDIEAGLTWIGRVKDPSEKKPGHRGRWVAQVSISTLQRKHTAIRNMLKLMKIRGRVAENVAAGEIFTLGNALPAGVDEDEDQWPDELPETAFDRRWTIDQMAQFLDASVEHPLGSLFAQYVYSSARRGEWAGARRDALKNQGLEVRSTVRVVKRGGDATCPMKECGQKHRGRKLVYARAKNTTTRKSAIVEFRWFPICDDAWSTLQNHLAAQRTHIEQMGDAYVDHKLIFCEADGSPLYPGTITNEFDKLVKALGLPKIRLHDLRHFAVQIYLAAGIDVETVAKVTGHDPRVCHEIYNAIRPELTAERFQKANEAITRLRGRPGLRVVLGAG